MIGETIVAMLCVIALLLWVLIMAVADQNRRLSRLERLIAQTHGHSTGEVTDASVLA